jgi:hypothetical protein
MFSVEKFEPDANEDAARMAGVKRKLADCR